MATEPSQQARRRRSDFLTALFFGLVCLIVYNANLRTIAAADTYGARYLPFSILHNHSLALDPVAPMVAHGYPISRTDRHPAGSAFWVRVGVGGNLVSFYPVTVPLLVSPLYIPATLYVAAHGWDPMLLDGIARIMEKLSASILTALSVMLVYLLLRRRCEPPMAALLTAVYAFGTTTWVISSQALWAHGLAEVLVAATMLLITGPATRPCVLAAGFFCALIACNRQPDAVIAAALGLYGLWWAGRRAPLLLIGGAIPTIALFAYNLSMVGNLFGAYALATSTQLSTFLIGNPVEGILGLLFSPSRGLFVFSPFLLVIPLFLLAALRDTKWRWLTIMISIVAVVQVVGYSFGDWRQGASFGPRWLTDLLPMLIWIMPPILAGFSRPGRLVFALACAVAIGIQVVGAFWYGGASDAALFAKVSGDPLRAAWDIRNAPFIADLQHPPVGPDFAINVAGNIDIARIADGGEAPHVDVEGWALVNHRSPTDVALMIDGLLVNGTGSFFDRPDVVKALGDASASGWRLSAPADHLRPGRHQLSVLVRATPWGEPRLLKQVELNVTEADVLERPPGLQDAAQQAVRALLEHQQPDGYWLVSFTAHNRFNQPHPEMNTYLNAVIVDFLAPVAKAAGLEAASDKARSFLTDQIEPGGLVRYHGRPDGPTIGTLGCAITPDADDTSLVWRLAPSLDTQRLKAALATLDAYRRPDGLYRTWLASQKQYECIDPGRNPDPADIGIQMHVYLLLKQADPPAAEALCAAMLKKEGDDDIWPYYEGTPLVVALRLDEVAAAGCPLHLPASRLQTNVPGQDIWMRVAERLHQVETQPPGAASYEQTAALLGTVAANDFSLLDNAPPLLYHNDFTASVSRFYWSRDFGYALWLRLYFENESMRSELACAGQEKQTCGGK